MQATIRLDAKYGRDCGLIIVTDAEVFTEPLFFSLQRFTDGKFLTANSLWRTGKEELRAVDFSQKNGKLSILIGPDILYELDSDTPYRMTVNRSKSFPLTVSREIIRSLQGKAALQAYLESVPPKPAEVGETVAQKRQRRMRVSRPVVVASALFILLCAGYMVHHFSYRQLLELDSAPINLSDNLTDAQVEAVLQEHAGDRAAGKNVLVSGRLAHTLSAKPFFSTENLQTLQSNIEGDEHGESFLDSVNSYLTSGLTSPTLNVALARKARVAGADTSETDTAFMLLQSAAEKGNPEAMFLVAQYYDPLCPLPRGSVDADPLLAREWYRRAEAGGLMNAYLSSNALHNYLQKKAGAGDKQAEHALRNW